MDKIDQCKRDFDEITVQKKYGRTIVAIPSQCWGKPCEHDCGSVEKPSQGDYQAVILKFEDLILGTAKEIQGMLKSNMEKLQLKRALDDVVVPDDRFIERLDEFLPGMIKNRGKKRNDTFEEMIHAMLTEAVKGLPDANDRIANAYHVEASFRPKVYSPNRS